MKKSEKKVAAKKSDKPSTIFNEIDSKARAKGVKLPAGNPLLVFVKNSESPLPTNLQPYLAKIAARGKDGVKLDTLLPEDEGQNRYARWLVKQLVKRGLVKPVGEAPAKKEEKQ